MRGRARGHQERIITLAHQVEAMARQKVLKPVAHYLPKAKPPTRGGAERSILTMLKAKLAQQQNAKGKSHGS